jgi:hypothetical protein
MSTGGRSVRLAAIRVRTLPCITASSSWVGDFVLNSNAKNQAGTRPPSELDNIYKIIHDTHYRAEILALWNMDYQHTASISSTSDSLQLHWPCDLAWSVNINQSFQLAPCYTNYSSEWRAILLNAAHFVKLSPLRIMYLGSYHHALWKYLESTTAPTVKPYASRLTKIQKTS